MAQPYDTTGISPIQTGPVPEGYYFLRIKEAEETWSKNQDYQVKVVFEIDDAQYAGRTLWHYVTFLNPDKSGAGIAVHFLKSIGEPYEGKIIINPANWRGRMVRAYVVQKVNPTNGRRGNAIDSLEPVAAGTTATHIPPPVAAAPKPASADDEVPF